MVSTKCKKVEPPHFEITISVTNELEELSETVVKPQKKRETISSTERINPSSR